MGRIAPPPKSGLSYFDVNLGGLVTEGPDVCDYKSRLKELDPTLNAMYDEVQLEWIITARDATNTEYFILSDEDLISAYHRVEKARNDRPGAETAEQMSRRLEREHEQALHEDNKVFREIAGDAAERLLHAFKKDGLLDHDDIFGVKPAPAHMANRAIRRTVDPRKPSAT